MFVYISCRITADDNFTRAHFENNLHSGERPDL